MSTVLSYILGVVVVAVGILLSILLHETGHFVFAKLFKVRVGQFMVGFGKTLWSRKIGETEFGIKALPLGGYISMSGMYPPIKPGGKARDARAKIAGGECGFGVDLAGQKALAQRAERHKSDAKLFQQRQDFRLGVAGP